MGMGASFGLFQCAWLKSLRSSIFRERLPRVEVPVDTMTVLRPSALRREAGMINGTSSSSSKSSAPSSSLSESSPLSPNWPIQSRRARPGRRARPDGGGSAATSSAVADAMTLARWRKCGMISRSRSRSFLSDGMGGKWPRAMSARGRAGGRRLLMTEGERLG